MKKIARSVYLCLICGLILCACSAGKGTITYEFTGDDAKKAGYAQGIITFETKKPGMYQLYWSDEAGALNGYYEIAGLEITEDKPKAQFEFGYHTAIPAGATKIIAVEVPEETEGDVTDLTVKKATGVYDIPAEKQLGYKQEDALYTFNSYSDIHIDEEKWGEVPGYWWEYAELHWAQALQYSVDKDVDFIITSGDHINNAVNRNTDKEWKSYQYILASSDYVNPIYEASGNHEIKQAGMLEEGLVNFILATGLDSKKKTIQEWKPYYFIEEPGTGDLFIFMALEGGYRPANDDEFSVEQIAWVEGLLKENYGKGKNIYIIEHANIAGYGPGDDTENPYYEGGMNTDLPSNAKFKAILEKYTDVIWISGHTHEDYALGYNYTNNNGNSCHMIHNSGVANPTHVTDGELDYALEENLSQGYLVEVYEKAILFQGANICDKKIYPEFSYIIDGNTTASEIAEKTFRSDWAMTTGKARSVQANAKSVLGIYYEYSSYDTYQRLKKSYYKYVDADVNTMSNEELSIMYDELGKGIKSLCELVEGVEIAALKKK